MAALSEEFLKEIRKHVRYDCIFNITHINNLVSIFENGLLSYNRAKKLTHEDIAETGIQERRKYIQVPNGLMLHDYASCYINARNAMLFKKLKEGMEDSLCVIAISCDVLNLDNVAISDRNASVSICAFHDIRSAIRALNFYEIYKEYWEDMQISQAEVLIPDRIDAKYILGIYVANEKAKFAVEQILSAHQVNVKVSNFLFFKKRGLK